MRIAIIGATSQIAKDLILSFAAHADHELFLFARNPVKMTAWINESGLVTICQAIFHLDAFDNIQKFDAIFNFVGVGDPAQASAMGASIFDVTYAYDELVLNYIKLHQQCRYFFLSSGAAYGAGFDSPASKQSNASVPINNLQAQDWYSVAKLYAECRHRSLAHLPIIDIRVFNYLSYSQDLDVRYLICDILRAIRDGTVLAASSDNVVRDYLHPDDFYRLVAALLQAPATNTVVDCFSRAPISKFELLKEMEARFGLRYELNQFVGGVSATGAKLNYYSKNYHAMDFGYRPAMSSIECVINVAERILNKKDLL